MSVCLFVSAMIIGPAIGAALGVAAGLWFSNRQERRRASR